MQCEFIYEAWGPNEGCKEFMDEPERWPCPERARAFVVFENHVPSETEARTFNIELEVQAFCLLHQHELTERWSKDPEHWDPYGSEIVGFGLLAD